MRPIIAVVLLLDVAILLGVSFVVALRKASSNRIQLRWRTFVIPLLLAGWVSVKIGARYATGTGVEITRNLGLVLVGMGIMSILVALRKWRGLDLL